MRELGFVVDRLLTPETALATFFERVTLAPPGLERVALEDAFDRVLATEAVASGDMPAHARSTMDGFAVDSSGPLALRVVGDIAMGRAAPRGIAPDETLRIPTGGALPPGADAVVPLEDVDDRGTVVTLRERVKSGDCVTPRGADLRAGELALERGRRIGAPELGVLATLGNERVDVYVRPRIGIVSTGDELVSVGATPGAGQVRDSNRYAIAGSLRALGAQPVQCGHASDDPDVMRGVLCDALARCDAVVLTGGSSVGARDFTPRVVDELGAPGTIVHGLRVKPGKPTVLGAAGRKPVIGLPGNPTSALTILEAVVRPIVAALTGRRDVHPFEVEAIAGAAFEGRAGWTWYVPARLVARSGTHYAYPFLIRSSLTTLLARSAGFVTLGEKQPRVDAGAPVRVALFSLGGAPVEMER